MSNPTPRDGGSETEAERLAEIEARANAATEGTWQWFGNTRVHQVYLATRERGRQFVMQFDRWGMRDAQPVFQTNHRMVPLAKMGDAVETDHNNEIIRIKHPDAEFIAHARQDIPWLLARVRELESALAARSSGGEDTAVGAFGLDDVRELLTRVRNGEAPNAVLRSILSAARAAAQGVKG